MQRILPPTLVAALIAAMVALALLVPTPNVGWVIRLSGAAILAVGLILNLRYATLFDRVGTNIKTFDDPDQLVLSGAFRWTRNPMYLGFLLFLLGLAVVLGAPAALFGPAAFFVAADRWYIPFEEQRMEATFETDYDQYQRSVHRWIGRTNS